MNPLPEPAVIFEGPAVPERISGYFYHITVDWALFHFDGLVPRLGTAGAVNYPQLFAFVNVAAIFARQKCLLGGSAEQAGNALGRSRNTTSGSIRCSNPAGAIALNEAAPSEA
jgi:hypothetical protein